MASRALRRRAERAGDRVPEGCSVCRRWPTIWLVGGGDPEPPTVCGQCGRDSAATRAHVGVRLDDAQRHGGTRPRPGAHDFRTRRCVRDSSRDDSPRVRGGCWFDAIGRLTNRRSRDAAAVGRRDGTRVAYGPAAQASRRGRGFRIGGTDGPSGARRRTKVEGVGEGAGWVLQAGRAGVATQDVDRPSYASPGAMRANPSVGRRDPEEPADLLGGLLLESAAVTRAPRRASGPRRRR